MKRIEQVQLDREKCRSKLFHFFHSGFADQKYIAWEHGYKWNAHLEWDKLLNKQEFKRLLEAGSYSEITIRAVRLETHTNLLFSFEKMALRDAVKSAEGAHAFPRGLYNYVYSEEPLKI